ncbi:MAG: TonB family protein [Lentisphaeria bacterium]|nr:TonB family protein [Lentisphaeria bacterium]
MTTVLSQTALRLEQERGENTARYWKICAGVFLIHTLVLGVPLLWAALDAFFRPPKVNAFRVKIGPKELSHAPQVGPPERTRPGGAPAPAEPKVVIPKPKPRPKARPKKLPKEPKVTVPKARPRPRPNIREPKVVVPRQTAKTSAARTKPPRDARPKKQDDGIYHPPQGRNDIAIGGRNFNANVPIGTRNRGQEKGKEDHRTPGGGLTEEMETYNRKAGMYLKNVWMQPPRFLLGNQLPAVTIELEIAPDGRVTGKRILKTSGIAAMDDSAKSLLRQLDRMPAPPKAAVVQFILQTDD